MHWPGMLFPVSYYVTSGQVTVTDVLVYEAARACTNEISLDIDVEAWWANGGMPGYEALTQGNGTLKGWLTFSYGDTGENITVTGRDDVVWEDCLPPQLEDPQSFWAAKTGQHVFENAPYPQDVFDGEVRYWGTAENEVDLEVWDIIRDAPEQWALWRRSVVRIVPPTKIGRAHV